jgi:hypothetical protein
MDKEQARFILRSFRPDGADAQDPEFAAALALAAADRELGEWLARERAQDAAFAEALSGLAIPEDLRNSILDVLNGSGEGEWTAMDEEFVGALAGVRAPEGLREQILAAMTVESGGAKAAPKRAWNWLRSASIAAAVVLGAWLAFQVPGSGLSNGSALVALTPVAMEREAVSQLKQHFALDREDPDHAALFAFLARNDLPVPKTLPPGLEGAPAVGCKIMKLYGHKASLVCFKMRESGVVHLVVMDLDEVTGDFGALEDAKKKCRRCPVSGWSSARWTDNENAYMLLGDMKADEMAEAF